MRLLLVDNDTDTRQELYDICVRCGYDVTPLHCLEVTAAMAKKYDVIVLSGGYWYDDAENHLQTYARELELIRTTTVPIIGICLGMQLMHVAYNGEVPLLDQPQSGLRRIAINSMGQQLLNLPSVIEVHKNHTRGVIAVGSEFEVLATSPNHIEIMMHTKRPLLGVQFHPEVGDPVFNTALFKSLLASMHVPVPNRLQSSLRIAPAQSVLDARWHKELTAAAGVSTDIYTLLGPSAQKLETARLEFFASNKQHNPNLQPTGFDEPAVEQTKARLEQLLAQVSGEVTNPHVRSAYEQCITELLQKIDMLFAALHGDSATFATLNTIVYGAPDQSIFAAALAHFRDQALSYSTHTSHEVRAAAEVVLSTLPHTTIQPAVITPTPSVFQDIKRRHEGAGGFYNELFKGARMPKSNVITTETGDVLLHRLLKNVGADSYRLMDATDGFWAVHYNPPSIVRPATYELPRDQYIATVGHEIGSHLLERLNGADQPLKLLGFGLQGYEAGNEGRAVLREQVVYADWQQWSKQLRWQDILRRHLSISLALGTDGNKPRTFAQTFAIVNAIDLLWELAHGDAKHATQRADNRTWDLLVRSLKGTNGMGGAYHKDIVYLQGNAACWQLAAINPHLIMAGDRGKFSVVNQNHLTLLQNLGIDLTTN